MGIKQRISSLAISITHADSTAEATEVVPVPQWIFIKKSG